MGLDVIQRFDLYKKVPHDLKKGTLSGAVISVLCIVVTMYLLFAELVLFTNGSLKTSIFVSYQNHEDDIPVTLNITIEDKLCADIAVDYKNTHGQADHDITGIRKKQVEDDCNLDGSVNIKKTSGALVVIPVKGKDWNEFEYKVEPLNPNPKGKEPCVKVPKDFIPPANFKPPKGYKVTKQQKNVMMNHKIHKLEFGKQVLDRKRWNEVLPSESKPFRALAGAKRDFPINVSHDYHLRLVPTTFVDQNKHSVDSYQYSYGYQNFIMGTPSGMAPPSIIFRYEISPMEIKYQFYRKPTYHMLTMMCAIIGGIVTIAGVIDKILFNTHQLLKEKIMLGKLS